MNIILFILVIIVGVLNCYETTDFIIYLVVITFLFILLGAKLMLLILLILLAIRTL